LGVAALSLDREAQGLLDQGLLGDASFGVDGALLQHGCEGTLPGVGEVGLLCSGRSGYGQRVID
jgi:hypothetical protein